MERCCMKKLAVVLHREPSGNIPRGTTGFLPTSEVLPPSWVDSRPRGCLCSGPKERVWIWDLQVGRGIWRSAELDLPAEKYLKSCSTEFPSCCQSSGNLLTWCMVALRDRDPSAMPWVMGGAFLIQPCS